MRNVFRPSITVDEGLHETLQQAQEGQYAVVVKPPEEAEKDPREAAEEVFKALHGTLESVSFEIQQRPDGRIEFHSITQSWDDAIFLKNRIIAAVQGTVDIVPASLELAAGETVAGARLEYAKDHLIPLQTTRSHRVADDPWAQVFETIAEEPDSRALIQFVVKPIEYSWPFRWGYRLLQLWDERIEDTWTTRWSRWPSPTLMTNRRRRKQSVEIASLVSLLLYGAWIGIGGNPITALPSIQLLDALLGTTIGPIQIPADFTVALFGPTSPVDFLGQVTYGLIMVVMACLYTVALVGDGLERPERKTAKTEGKRARSTGGKEDRRTSRAEKETGEAIQAQGRDVGFRVNARVLTIGEDAASVGTYRDELVQQFKTGWRSSATKQQLRGTTMGRFLHLHHGLGRFVKRVAHRKSTRTRWFWIQKVLFQGTRKKPIYMALFEVASLWYWPVKSRGGAGAIEYARATETEQLLEGEDDFERVEPLEDREPDAPTAGEELPEDEPSRPESPSTPDAPSSPDQPSAETDGGTDTEPSSTETDGEDDAEQE